MIDSDGCHNKNITCPIKPNSFQTLNVNLRVPSNAISVVIL